MRRLKLSTSREVRQALTKIANWVLNNQLDPKAANTLILCCNAVLSAIRTDEQERKLAELEQLVKDMQK